MAASDVMKSVGMLEHGAKFYPCAIFPKKHGSRG